MSPVGPDDVRAAGSLSRAVLEGAVDHDWSVRAGSLEWDCRFTAGHIADATNRHLARLIEAMAELFAQVIEAAPADVRAYHHSGMWDKETLAAFGCIEAVVHTGDIAAGLGIGFEPPRELCAKVVAHLFVGAPEDVEPWSVLWWATGRSALEGQPSLGPDWPSYWAERAKA